MAMNLGAIMQLKNAWSTFTGNHPKFPGFLKAAQGTLKAGTVLEFKITTEDGKTIESNLRLTQSDMDLFESLKQMRQ